MRAARTPPTALAILSPDLIDQAALHLRRADPIMAHLITQHGRCTLADHAEAPFHLLATLIIRQQLATRSADAIQGRVAEQVGIPLEAAHILRVPVSQFLAAGLSLRKVTCLRELATWVMAGRLALAALAFADSATVVTTLTAVRGIGPWTAEMFLIFGLKRPNVLSLADAGLQRAVRLLYGDTERLARLGRRWDPYCSVASWYLWRELDAPS